MVQGSPLSPWTSSICQATDAAQYKCDSLKYSCLECDYTYGECYCFSAGNVQHEALLVLIKYLYCVQASAGPQQLKSISFVASRSQRMRYKCIHPSFDSLTRCKLNNICPHSQGGCYICRIHMDSMHRRRPLCHACHRSSCILLADYGSCRISRHGVNDSAQGAS